MQSKVLLTGKILFLELLYIYLQKHDFNKYHVTIFGFKSLRCLNFGAVLLVHRQSFPYFMDSTVWLAQKCFISYPGNCLLIVIITDILYCTEI